MPTYFVLPDYPPLFWISAAFALCILGMGKSGFGGGLGILAVPLMSLTIPPVDAAALLLPLLLIMDVFSVHHYRNNYDRSTLLVLLPTAFIGIMIAGYFFRQFSDDEQLMRFGIGIVGLLFVCIQVARSLIFGRLSAYKMPTTVGRAVGLVSGITSTLVHAGGPIANLYILPQNLPRHIYVGTTVILWFVVNIAKLIPYTLLGLLHIGNLTTVLLLSPFCYAGVRFGIFLNGRVNQQWFLGIVYALLFVTALQLVSGRNFFTDLLNLL